MEVIRLRLNTLTYEYELFIMKPKENIYDMQSWFTHIVSHMKNLGKTFQNEDLVVKILRSLNRIRQPKVIAISKYRDLSTMDMATLFGKLEEHDMDLKRLVNDKDGDKKKKGLPLKVEEKDSDSYN